MSLRFYAERDLAAVGGAIGTVILWLYVNRVPSTMRNRSSINLLVTKWRSRP
jgi:hypothetical protein